VEKECQAGVQLLHLLGLLFQKEADSYEDKDIGRGGSIINDDDDFVEPDPVGSDIICNEIYRSRSRNFSN
jgi:hypothetical protein